MPYELIIIGAGISGLASAITAYEAGLENVLIVDHEKEKGGFFSLLFQTSEFQKEKQLLDRSSTLPYEIWHQSTVVGFFPGESGECHQLNIQTPAGARTVETYRVMLCSGSLEKPREAHRIAGPRPAGIVTPTMALNLMVRNYLPGKNILLIENGRISRGAGELLNHPEVHVERLAEEHWELLKVSGIARLNGVELKHRSTGEIRSVECDTLIFSRNRIPCTFYLKGSPVERDEHHAVRVDERGRTNIPMVFAAGACTNRGDDDHFRSIELAEAATLELLGT